MGRDRQRSREVQGLNGDADTSDSVAQTANSSWNMEVTSLETGSQEN